MRETSNCIKKLQVIVNEFTIAECTDSITYAEKVDVLRDLVISTRCFMAAVSKLAEIRGEPACEEWQWKYHMRAILRAEEHFPDLIHKSWRDKKPIDWKVQPEDD